MAYTPTDAINELVDKILTKDSQDNIIKLFRNIIDSHDPLIIIEQVMDRLYQLAIVQIENTHIQSIWNTMLKDIQLLKYAPSIHNAAEMFIMKSLMISSLPTPEEIITEFNKIKKKV